MSKILITGATGFIGSNMAHRLVGKHEVHILKRERTDTWRIDSIMDKLIPHNVCLSDANDTRRAIKEIQPDIVYHFATYGAYSSQNDWINMQETNVTSAINLMDACANVGVKAFINAGTSSEYGIKPRPMKETDLPEPNTHYGLTKLTATLYAQHLWKRFGFPAATFRIFAAYGKYEDRHRLIPSVIQPYLKNQAPTLTSPHSVRDFIYIDDILDAMELAAKTPTAKGEVLNLGYGTQRRVEAVAAIVKSLAKSDKNPIWNSQQASQEEPAHWEADMSKTEKTLHWKPTFALEEGLKETVKWFRKEGGIYVQTN